MPISRIKTDGIQDDAITSAKIGVDVIVADDLAANSVTVSELTDGAVTGAKLANNLNYDSGTLYLDSTNNRVGIGTITPSKELHVKGDIDVEGGTGGVAVLRFKAEEIHGTVEGINIGNNFGGLAFKTNNNGTVAEKMRIDNAGNMGIGTSSVATNFRQEIVGLAGSNSGPASSGSTQDSSAVMRIRPGGGFTAALDIGQGGGTGSWLQSTDTSNLATNYSLLLNPNGGNVGIGTSPSSRLHVKGDAYTAITLDGTAGGQVDFYRGGSRHAQIFTDGTDGDIVFRNNTVQERMRIDGTTGNVAIGTSNTTSGKTTINLTGVAVAGDTDGATIGSSGIINLYNSNNGATNSTVMLLGSSSVSVVGQIASGIGFTRENTSNWGTQLRFYTHTISTSDLDELKERMRIDSYGKTFVTNESNVSDNNNANLCVNHSISTRGINLHTNGTSGSDRITFQNDNGTVGTINTSGSSTSYGTSSDYRLKENVTADWDATTRLKQLNPVRFNFIADADTTVDGFLAHEVQSVVPEAISGTHNEVDDDGNPVYQGIDQSKLVPLLVKTIQELEARITALESN